ncbi:MAG: hypothetical protein E7279_01375 [Lachnospiraceae bacterium]|nr:hypothetical protein [Lachnospiraceae bacterium]
MKVPKQIHEKLERRAELAIEIMVLTTDIDNWLEKNNIDVSDEYKTSSCLIYLEPQNVVDEIEERIKKAHK